MITSPTCHGLFRRAIITLPKEFHQRRWLAVKELSWCSPKRSSAPSTKIEKNVPSGRVEVGSSIECSSFSCHTKQKTGQELETEAIRPTSKFGIIAAMDESRVIGIDNQVPWEIPEDREYFYEVTKGCTLIIGKNCFFESSDFSHLKTFDHTIVVSTTLSQKDIDDSGLDNVHLVRSFKEALVCSETLISTAPGSGDDDDDNDDETFRTWIGGGQRLYEEAIRHPNSSEIRLTSVHSKTSEEIISGTNRLPVAFFPAKYRWDNTFKEIKEMRRTSSDEKSGLSYTFSVHRRKR